VQRKRKYQFAWGFYGSWRGNDVLCVSFLFCSEVTRGWSVMRMVVMGDDGNSELASHGWEVWTMRFRVCL